MSKPFMFFFILIAIIFSPIPLHTEGSKDNLIEVETPFKFSHSQDYEKDETLLMAKMKGGSFDNSFNMGGIFKIAFDELLVELHDAKLNDFVIKKIEITNNMNDKKSRIFIKGYGKKSEIDNDILAEDMSKLLKKLNELLGKDGSGLGNLILEKYPILEGTLIKFFINKLIITNEKIGFEIKIFKIFVPVPLEPEEKEQKKQDEKNIISKDIRAGCLFFC